MAVNSETENRIGNALVRRGFMEDSDVEAVLKMQRAGDNRLFGEIAIDLGYLDVRDLMDYLRKV